MKKKRILFFVVAVCFCCSGVFGIEVGVLGGKMSNPSQTTYGFSAGMGLLVPLVKLEVEYCRIKKVELMELPNVITAGVKLRPKLGNFSPYAIIGVGADFYKFNLRLSEYDKFTFIGGGVHYFFTGMVSIRADIRFFNYSGFNRTRFTGGIFIHI